MNADGTNRVRLSSAIADDSSPAWSPDGTRIAFHSRRGELTRIYLVDSEGGEERRLTLKSGFAPAWSGDGSQIAFYSRRDGNPEIYLMDADGSGQTRITHNPGEDVRPAWSPGG